MLKQSIPDSPKRWPRFAKAILALVFVGSSAWGDEFHRKDTLVGERAAGLGGAFVAISDDPSGIYHNPAGILFSLENYLSVSSNAYGTTQQEFQEVYPGQSYSYRSRGLVPSLFGFTQTVGKGKFGFAVITPNAEATDQRDVIRREADGSGPLRIITRNFFRQDTTYLVGPAYAIELAENLSFGVSFFAMVRLLKTTDNTLEQTDPGGTDRYFLHQANLNRTSVATFPKIGLQYMPIPKWSIGLTLAKPFDVGGSSSAQVVQTVKNQVPTGTATNDLKIEQSSDLFHGVATPLEFSLGTAYFFSKRFLITGQIDFQEGTGFVDFPLRAMANWSVGTEYYLSEGFATRFGLYSNNTIARPLEAGGRDQSPFVNMVGAAVGLSMYRPGSSLTLTVSGAKGEGQGQAFAGQTAVHKVTQSNFTVYLGGSYQL